jgi:hypothetical protein
MFLPCPILGQMAVWATGPHRKRIWGSYGFVDSLNLDKKWFDEDVIGITVGALYLSLANTHYPTSAWKTFHSIDAVKRAIQKISAN